MVRAINTDEVAEPNAFAVQAAVTAFTEGGPWLDCRELLGDANEFARYLRETTGLYVSEGAQYGNGGTGFLRLNMACPRAVLEDGLKRLEKGAPAYEKWVVENC